MTSVMAEVQELDARLRARRFRAAKVSVALAAAAMFVFVVAAAVSNTTSEGAHAAGASAVASLEGVESAARFADEALRVAAQAEELDSDSAQSATHDAERTLVGKSKARKERSKAGKASRPAPQRESASSGRKSRADRAERRAQHVPAGDSDAPSPEVATTTVTSRPATDHATLVAVAIGGSCAFTIDGVGHGASAHARVSVATGTHSVTCRPALGGASRTRSITLAAGEVKSTVFKL